ncbi:hypothetical protein JB92DRAFT_3142363 [Gautieria morchelliformis]|nr:hypothetical protein JB92DRAFT_3142363 [Gautieria morchelliformis]
MAETRLGRFHPLALARAGPCAPRPLRTRTCPSIQRPTRAADRGTLRRLALGLIRDRDFGLIKASSPGGAVLAARMAAAAKEGQRATRSAATAANPTGIVCPLCREDRICGACKGKGKGETSPCPAGPNSEAGPSRPSPDPHPEAGPSRPSPDPNPAAGSLFPAAKAVEDANRDCSTVPRVSPPVNNETTVYSKGLSKPFGTGAGWGNQGKQANGGKQGKQGKQGKRP